MTDTKTIWLVVRKMRGSSTINQVIEAFTDRDNAEAKCDACREKWICGDFELFDIMEVHHD